MIEIFADEYLFKQGVLVWLPTSLSIVSTAAWICVVTPSPQYFKHGGPLTSGVWESPEVGPGEADTGLLRPGRLRGEDPHRPGSRQPSKDFFFYVFFCFPLGLGARFCSSKRRRGEDGDGGARAGRSRRGVAAAARGNREATAVSVTEHGPSPAEGCGGQGRGRMFRKRGAFPHSLLLRDQRTLTQIYLKILLEK